MGAIVPDRVLATRLGLSVRQARRESGLTQAEVAELIGLSSDVFGRMERGAFLPRVATLIRLCGALGVTSDQLLGMGRQNDVRQSDGRDERDGVRPEILKLANRLPLLSARQVKLLGAIAIEMRR